MPWNHLMPASLRACDIFGRDWSPSANGRRIYQIVCYKMIPNYYPYSINFIFSTYYPINIQNTHILEVCDWQKKHSSSCVVKENTCVIYISQPERDK